MIGPGKYDDLATRVREEAEADAILLMLAGGNLGDGFSVQAPLSLLVTLPAMLRAMADEIEEDLPR